MAGSKLAPTLAILLQKDVVKVLPLNKMTDKLKPFLIAIAKPKDLYPENNDAFQFLISCNEKSINQICNLTIPI